MQKIMYKQIKEQQHHFDYWTVREQFITTCMNETLACIYSQCDYIYE